MITSLSNKSVREVVLLNQKAKARNKQGLFVVEGPKMFAEAPEERITRVYIAQRAEKELREVYGEKLDRVFCEVVADPVLTKCPTRRRRRGF